MPTDLDERDLRVFLGRMAEEMPTPAETPPAAIRRARTRLALTAVIGTLAAVLVIVGSFSGVRTLLRAEPSVPAATGPTPPDPGSSPLRVDGEILEHVCCDGALQAVDPETGQSRLLVDGEVGQAAWSPDGTRLAYEVPCSVAGGNVLRPTTPCADAQSGSAGIWVQDGSGAPRLVSSFFETGRVYEQYERHFAWSPDGSRLAFVRLGDGLYVADADGAGATLLAAFEAAAGPPSWSPDGSTIAYAADGAVYAIPSAGGTPTRLSDDGLAPAWSPDGTLIAFSRVTGTYVVNPDGTGLREVGDGNEFAWSPSGAQLVYNVGHSVNGGFLEELWVVAPGGSDPTAIVRSRCCSGVVDGTLTWTPEGDGVAFLAAEQPGGQERWRVVATDGSEADRSIEELPEIDLLSVLDWQPCLCTVGFN